MQVTLTLPDDLARRARDEGLLSAEAVQGMLEDAIRRVAGQRLLKAMDEIQAAGIPPMTEDEVANEVMAHRAAKRAQAQGSQARSQGLP